MSQEYAWPSSSQLEFEARRLHATPSSTGRTDLNLPTLLSGLPQAMDLGAWAIAGAVIFPQVFFPGLSVADAIAVGIGLWALAPAVRWLKSPVFAMVQRRHGRGVRLTAARVLLGASTAAIAFLPDASHAGWAAGFLLVACRLAQGVAWSGLPDPAPSARAGERRASRVAICGLTSLIGFLVAGGLFAALSLAVEQADFLQWGWRYPFAMAVAVNIVALFADLRLLATDNGELVDPRSDKLATVSGVPINRG